MKTRKEAIEYGLSFQDTYQVAWLKADDIEVVNDRVDLDRYGM